MHAMLSSETALRLASVDDFLGDRQNRFFGEGFKRVTQDLTEITVRPGAARIDATAGIRIPGTWSRKGQAHQRPHLSTIDAMVFGARLTGLYAAHTHGLSADDPFLVRSVSIKAGTSPDEENLDHFGVSGTVAATSEGSVPGRLRTTMDCAVGSMTVRVEADHPGTRGAAPGSAEGSYSVAQSLDGPWNDAPFGASHHGRHQFLADVQAEDHTADADLTITNETGPDGPRLPATMVDLFVSALQLGQILLYRLDGVDRASSHTLWMRSTTITPVPTVAAGAAYTAAAAADEGDGRFRVTLARPAKLPAKQGTWRAARITATHAGLRLACNVAHLLP
ncbi:AvrD family protein [Streptomyces sp. TRM49041]|uniref:AvrD family protein n=1 Tax=Streptomyces sp. TRM49041 TaxID=2603216 RepID=UPI0011EC78A6|nr:AvrD family protein [Streptomyces sp. TRM49041]